MHLTWRVGRILQTWRAMRLDGEANMTFDSTGRWVVVTLFAVVAAMSLSVGAQQGLEGPQAQFERARLMEENSKTLNEAIALYKQVAEQAASNRPLAAQALLRMAESYQKLGDAQARRVYEQIVQTYADQPATMIARARLGATASSAAVRGDRAVWTGPKVDVFGRVSPDGRFITYTDWALYGNLSLHDLTTNSDRFLTPKKAWDDLEGGEAQYSAISPDGKQVAYGWWLRNANEVRVMPVSASGSQPSRRLLAFGNDEVRFIGVRDWSPDGKLLAIGIARTDGTSQVAVATVADGSIRVLKSSDWNGADSMFFSRDSRYIAIDLPAGDDTVQRDVFVLAVDGSREIAAVVHTADDRVLGWSPDGRYLLFSSDRTRSRSLWALPFVDSKPQGPPELVKSDIGSGYPLGLSDSGTLYYYKNISSRDVKVARIDLSAGKLLGPPLHFSQGLLPAPAVPHWSPDGRYLAYQTRGGEEGLAIRSLDTGEVRRMPRRLLYAQDPRWSPDGRSLIVGGRDGKGRDGIFQIDVQSGDATLVVYTPGPGSGPRWSLDGTKIHYKDGNSGTVKERDIRTGIEREVFTHPLLRNIEMSPDGRYLTVQTNIDPASQTSSVLSVSVAGGPSRELLRMAASEMFNQRFAMAWTPDSRALLTAKKSGAATELWIIEIDTGQRHKLDIDVSDWSLAEGGGSGGGFSLSPDGRSIAFLMGKSGAEVWAMENFLPALKASR